jgi:hypothetical protein
MYKIYLREPFPPIVGISEEGYVLITEAELDSITGMETIIRLTHSGEPYRIGYKDVRMIVKV